jgi:hypothetical protein
MAAKVQQIQFILTLFVSASYAGIKEETQVEATAFLYVGRTQKLETGQSDPDSCFGMHSKVSRLTM